MAEDIDGLIGERFHESPAVVQVTAPNPGPKTLGGTQAYIVGGPAECYVIDPGPDIEEYQRALAEFVRRSARTVRGILLTHGHPDHAPGSVRLASLIQAPIQASPRLDLQYFDSPPAFSALHDGDRLPIEGDTLVVLDTPGHSHDHLAFWLEGAGILFTGDTILGEGTSLVAPPEGDMSAYLRALDLLRDLDARLIAPGHGPLVLNPRATIEMYAIHRQQREAQIIRALQRQPATIEELVQHMYPVLDSELRALARGSVSAHLEKLHAEGRVQSEGDTHRLLA